MLSVGEFLRPKSYEKQLWTICLVVFTKQFFYKKKGEGATL